MAYFWKPLSFDITLPVRKNSYDGRLVTVCWFKYLPCNDLNERFLQSCLHISLLLLLLLYLLLLILLLLLPQVHYTMLQPNVSSDFSCCMKVDEIFLYYLKHYLQHGDFDSVFCRKDILQNLSSRPDYIKLFKFYIAWLYFTIKVKAALCLSLLVRFMAHQHSIGHIAPNIQQKER